ncbi:MAG: site-specific integrase [Carnobacterium sp.]|uniref:tyrosine-type recombinase/integrase n=1 Tax=Carnobacterium sp. TaxID=48221 RepID=UPI003C76EDA1
MDKKRRLNGSIKELAENHYKLYVTVGYNQKGNPVRRTKSIRVKSERQAEKALRDFIAELEGSNYYKPTKIKLEDFIYNEWLPKYAEKKMEYKTITLYLHMLENRFLPVIGGMMMSDVKTMHIVNIMNNLKRIDGKEGGLSRKTKKNALLSITSVFNLATEWQFIDSNPIKKIDVGPDERIFAKKTEPYNTHEIGLLFDALKKEPLEYQVIISIAVTTGAREGEVAALEDKHIDFSKNTITFEQMIIDKKEKGATLHHYTKTKTVKEVSVPDVLMVMIKRHIFNKRADRDFVRIDNEWSRHKFLFSNIEGKPKRVSSFYNRWTRFVKRRNLRYITFHDLRHSSATWLLHQGVNMKVIQERLGHKKISTTMDIYAHVLKEADQGAGDTFKNLF